MVTSIGTIIVICYTAIPAEVIADFGPQAICVEDSNHSTTVFANCVTYRCVQVEGSDLKWYVGTTMDMIAFHFCVFLRSN